MDTIWLAAPSAAIRVWRDAAQLRFQLNDAALAWASDATVLVESDWQALAVHLLGAFADADRGQHRVGGLCLAWQAVAWPPGHVCWLRRLGPAAGEAPEPSPLGAPIDVDFAQALELASISVWRIDPQRQRIHYNRAGYRLTGVPFRPEGLSLDEIRALTHSDDVPAMVQAYQEALARPGVVDVEGRYRNPDGSYRHLLTRRVAQRDAAGRVVAVMGVSIDQTEQIAARERARGLRQRIDTVAETAGVGIWSYDVASDLLEWNPQMFRIHGLPEGRPPRLREWTEQRVHPLDRAQVTAVGRPALRRGSATGGGFEAELRIVRPDGAVRWIEGRSVREVRDGREMLVGIVLDVTERHATRAALQSQQERLALATRAVGMGVWERDLAGTSRYWDAQMYRLRGLDPADPRSLDELTRLVTEPSDLGDFLALARKHLDTGAPYLREFRVRWPDGSVHWLVSAGTALRDEQGRAIGITGVNWDVSARRATEQALRAQQMAEAASRAKSEFIARMSHELRTPLNAVLGFAQLIELDAAHPLPPVPARRVERIRTAGTHLLALIEDVLDLAAIEAGRLPLALEPTELDAALDEVVEWVAPLATSLGVALGVPATRAWVRADPRRLRQVLVNLVSNAVKYNRRGGRVDVAAVPLERDGVPGHEVRVRDTGRGLSAQQIEHLFEPFNRLGIEREAIEGVGIGLVVVRHLVHGMGGRIEVESSVGSGTEFRVWLPAAPAQPRPSRSPREPIAPPLESLRAPLDATPAPAGGARLSVLYIEDNPVNVILVQELVALHGRSVLSVAPDGGSGVAQAGAQPFDLVLVDLQLPDIDGFEVLRRLRAQAPADRRQVVVGLSAHASTDDLRRALDAGFDDYWTKPIDFKRFLGGLDRIAAAQHRAAD
ncbi:MAG: PAS domain-containing protein [Burkholderiaceae bacterium]